MDDASLKEEIYKYAEHMLCVSNRDDVFDEVVVLLRVWDTKYASTEERRQAFHRIQHNAVKCPSFYTDPVMRAYNKEATRPGDPVYNAYIKEWKKGK